MPSLALRKFEGPMILDVNRMIQTHADITNGQQGNRGLGHLTRSGVLLLCAAWELYIEEVLVEAVEKIIERVASPSELPSPVKLRISEYIRASKHNLKPLEMAGDGWKLIYLEIAREWVIGLNTPNRHNVNIGFNRFIGYNDISGSWILGEDVVNDFVSLRGGVAHRGADIQNIRFHALKDNHKPNICQCASEMDNAISNFIRVEYPDDRFPWNRRNLDV